MKVDSLAPNAALVCAGSQRLALGFPEEIVKTWMKASVKPTGWIVPDARCVNGVVQWALEFPLYHWLFVQQQRTKLPVVVTRDAWPAVVEYLRLTLLGLQREEMRAIGVREETLKMLAHESEHLALKRPDGTVAPVTDFIEPVFYDDNVACIGELRIERHGGDVYTFSCGDERIEQHALRSAEVNAPPYAVAQASSPLVPAPFELVLLGASNGFDANNPCSNMVVQANGRCLLVDAGPYIRTLLRGAGVALAQIEGVVITHAHEDHAIGLSALLGAGQRMKLFISRENAEIMRRKLAILNADTHRPERLLDDAFDVQLVEVGQTYDFLGLELRFHYTMHSIPCTGMEVAQGARKLLIVGDSDSRAHIEAAPLEPARLAQLLALYAWRGDLILADAGEGAIHGAPVDFVNNDSRVVYFHTGKLIDPLYTLGRAGCRYALAPEPLSSAERGLGMRALVHAFNAPVDALTVLLDAAVAESLNAGQVLVREGDDDHDVFIVTAGELDVVVGGAAPIARIEAGEVVGERAAVLGGARTATIKAATSARILRIPGRVYTRFVAGHGLSTSLPEIWNKRRELDTVSALQQASAATKHKLATSALRKEIEAGATLIREGAKSTTVYVLLSGRVQVYKGAAPLLANGVPVILEPGALLGETAPFLGAARNASIVALDAIEVLAIKGADFKRIVEQSPQLFCRISRTVRERAA